MKPESRGAKALLCSVCGAVVFFTFELSAQVGRSSGDGLSWRATALDACSTVHEATEAVTNALTGEVTNRDRRYVEVSSGLNYVDESGQWVRSQDLVELTADGRAAAVRRLTKIVFNANLNTPGAITLITQSNRVFQAHPLCLAYYDAASGKAVILARMRDCVGELLPPNQVLYRSAFAGLEADVRLTCTKAAFESDIILLEQPPAPEACGLDPKTTRLEVWHEWLGMPEPRVTRRLLERETDPAVRASMVEPDFTDEILDFGDAWFPTGAAYATDGSAARGANVSARVRVPNLAREPGLTPVSKTWLACSGRTFVAEAVRWSEIQPKLAELRPARTTSSVAAPRERTLCLADLAPPRQSAPSNPPMQVASVEYPDASSRSYEDTAVSQGLTYCYVLALRRQDLCSGLFKESPLSNEFCISTCPEPPCGEEQISGWAFTDLGFILGGQDGNFRSYNAPGAVPASPWAFITPDQRTVRVSFENDTNCVVQHGPPNNPYQQVATMQAVIAVGCPTQMTLNWTGLAEQEDEPFEVMNLFVDDVLVGSAHAPGGTNGCAPMAAVVSTPWPPVSVNLSRGTHVLRIKVDTVDARYPLRSILPI